MAIFLTILGVAFMTTLVILGFFTIGIIIMICVIGNGSTRSKAKKRKNKRGA